MWDNVNSPEGMDKYGTQKKQDLPQRKSVTAREKEVLDRAWELKENLRTNIQVVRQRAKQLDPQLSACIEYAAKLYGFHLKEHDTRFKGALRIRRKVEEDLRKKFKLPVHQAIHDVTFPDTVESLSFPDFLKRVAGRQTDCLVYKLAAEAEKYTSGVLAILDLMLRNGFILESVKNYWGDMEKHHAICATFELIPDHRSVLHPLAAQNAPHSGCFFRVEFHTFQSYNCMVERRTALSHIEEHMYSCGEPYNKAAADMQVRFDTVMLKHWAEVEVPEGATLIGTACQSITDQVEFEESKLTWLSPAQKRIRRIHAVSITVLATVSVVIGFVAGRRFNKYNHIFLM
jgi:hypothetical protein